LQKTPREQQKNTLSGAEIHQNNSSHGISMPAVPVQMQSIPQTVPAPVIQREMRGEEEEIREIKPFQLKRDIVQRQEPGNGEHLQVKFIPVQRKANTTGLPDNLKTGIENLSGIDISDVKVHYNSGRPAQLQALAYAKGTDIHIGPGQEKHLPHEAWHVVQQKQGRVQPTMQMKDGAEELPLQRNFTVSRGSSNDAEKPTQMKPSPLPVVQRVISITKEQKELTSSAELIDRLSLENEDIDKTALLYIIEHMDRQNTRFHDLKNFQFELKKRGAFFENLRDEYTALLHELQLPDNAETKAVYSVVAASGPYWDVPAGKAMLRTRLTKVQTAKTVNAQVADKMDEQIGGNRDTNITAEQAEGGKRTSLMFSWLYQNSERFTFGIRQRVALQVANVRDKFNKGEMPAHATLNDAYDGELLNNFIDGEIMKAIREEIPGARDMNMIWPTVEYASNVFTILEGNEDNALDGLEAALITFIEEGFTFLRAGLALNNAQAQLNFSKELAKAECYPGRLANVKGALRPPVTETLYQKVNKAVLGENALLDAQSAVYVLADHYSESPDFADKSVANFIIYARGQLQGQLSDIGINHTVLDDSKVIDPVRYMLE
jgi:hypothetical protein